MTKVTVAGLWRYPLKSAKGYPVPYIHIVDQGPLHDHRWMVVDEHGMFVAQRQDRGLGVSIPQMSQITTAIEGGVLRLSAPGFEDLELLLGRYVDQPDCEVQIWRDIVPGITQGSKATAWITDYLSQYRRGWYRLVRLPGMAKRYTPDGQTLTAYTDGWPFLVADAASLDELNDRIAATRQALQEPPEEPLGWERFRPTIVLDGLPPNAVDRIRWMKINGRRLVGGTLCKRCMTTTTNQDTSRRGREPLRTLATYRANPDTKSGGVVFARNFRHHPDTRGIIAVGDSVEVNFAA